MPRLPLPLAVLLTCAWPCLAQTYLIVPAVNASGDSNLDWIGESVAEVVREDLARCGVDVISRRERAEAAQGLSLAATGPLTEASAMRLAIEVGAERMIFGEFSRIPDGDPVDTDEGGIHLQARIIDVAGVMRISDTAETGRLADLGMLQSKLAWRVLSLVSGVETPAWEEFQELYPPIRLDAMENYSRGLIAPDAEQRHRYFAQAARLDPEFSEPRFHLGLMYWEESSYKTAAQWLSEVSETDSHYLESNFLAGLCLYHIGDYRGASEAFQLVANHVPAPEVYNNLGLAQFRYRDPEAVTNLYKAAQADPGNPDYRFNIGYVLWRQGDLEGAKQRFEVVLGMQPDDEDASTLLERCVELRGPRMGDLTSEGMERLKTTFNDAALP